MRTQILVVACAAALCAGCFRSTTLITVRQDGSGTIEQEVGMTAQAAAMARGFRDSAEKGNAKQKGQELFTEADARKAGEQMGVRFVSMEPVKTAQLEGYRAKYAFDDITKVTFGKSGPAAASTGSPDPGAGLPPFGFGFQKRPDGAVLTVNMPPMDSSKLGPMGAMGGQGAGGKASEAETKQGMAMAKMMMQGMFVDVALAVEGRVRKTNAPYLDGSRITLLQLDFDKLLQDEAAMERMNKASDLKSLQNIPGLKVPVEPTLTVEFGR